MEPQVFYYYSGNSLHHFVFHMNRETGSSVSLIIIYDYLMRDSFKDLSQILLVRPSFKDSSQILLLLYSILHCLLLAQSLSVLFLHREQGSL